MGHRIAQLGIAFALLLPAAGQAKPTAADIAAARAECRDYRVRVERLEAGGSASAQTMAWERSAWDRACAYAERLMVEAGLEKPSAAPRAPAPVPQIVLTETRPAAAPQAGRFHDSPRVAEAAPAPAPTLELKNWETPQLVITERVRAEPAPVAP